MTMTWGSLGTSQNQTEETTNLPKDNRALLPEEKGKDTKDETIVGNYYTSLDDSQLFVSDNWSVSKSGFAPRLRKSIAITQKRSESKCSAVRPQAGQGAFSFICKTWLTGC